MVKRLHVENHIEPKIICSLNFKIHDYFYGFSCFHIATRRVNSNDKVIFGYRNLCWYRTILWIIKWFYGFFAIFSFNWKIIIIRPPHLIYVVKQNFCKVKWNKFFSLRAKKGGLFQYLRVDKSDSIGNIPLNSITFIRITWTGLSIEMNVSSFCNVCTWTWKKGVKLKQVEAFVGARLISVCFCLVEEAERWKLY